MIDSQFELMWFELMSSDEPEMSRVDLSELDEWLT